MSRPVIAALFALAATVPSVGRGEASYTIAIHGEVPLICRVALTGRKLHEFCNSGTGYRVYAAPSPELVGATLIVDGERQTLGTGETLLSSRTSPGIADHDVAVEGVPDGGSLSLRIEAI